MDMAKYILANDGRFHVKHELSDMADVDELFEQAARLVIENGVGSASLIQRRLEVGYARAARMLDQLEQAGIISAPEGNKPRTVIVNSFEEYTKNKGVDVGPEEVYPENIKKEWQPKILSNQLLSNLQKEVSDSNEVRIPIGIDKRRMVSASLEELGHLYVFNSPLSNSIGLLRSQLDFLVNTYSPDGVKLILSDDTRLLADFNSSEHLLTPVILDQSKVENALGWVMMEIERRLKMFQECGVNSLKKYNELDVSPLPEIVCVVSGINKIFSIDDAVFYRMERLMSSGHLVGIHLIVSSPLTMDRKYSKLLTSFPSKVVFKTFSTTQADTLGTDDAFDLSSGDEFIFIPAYGKVEKLTVCR